ncbi:hypothetical protein TUMSATVNIG1_60370 (plasmid) [Vibrio nigripulchritudo]|uniref:hypothetical protein n=1 Tax=Vibrio nigripulchritudo TaxID=28173 RepID=UPI0019091CCB|nr:hypothetical protein [Vibrio nigripulchritudo]BCL74051.1 hypothetical protein VNTUMSATTG_59880 [Vibrio nigripulchritudo]BDU35428.1 hypothetical protein TUMSATVNIG1_60370 [Vibrio nigripulchritudo]
MIKTFIDRVLLRKGSTSSGLFTFEKNGDFWFSEKERRDHIESFGQPKPIVGKTRLNDQHRERQRKLEEAFKLVPEGVVVEWGITDGAIKFLVKEKPVNFSEQQVQDLVTNLNAIALDGLTSTAKKI